MGAGLFALQVLAGISPWLWLRRRVRRPGGGRDTPVQLAAVGQESM